VKIVVGVTLAISLVAAPGTFVQTDGPVTVRWEAESGKDGLVLPFAERLWLTLEVDGRGPIEVRLPENLLRTPGWREAERTTETREKHGGETRWRQRIALEPLAPVDALVQLEPWRYRIGEGDWQTTQGTPVAVRVTTRSTAADDTPRDITGPEQLPPPFPTPFHRITWLVGGSVMLVAFIVIAVRVGRRRFVATRSALQRARDELTRLDGLKLLDAGKTERHCTLLANILRRFVEQTYQVPARHQTTPEFLAQVRAVPVLTKDAPFFESFLTECDTAKFAPAAVAPQQGRRLTDDLRKWLEDRIEDASRP
jgi:hypothetical protein